MTKHHISSRLNILGIGFATFLFLLIFLYFLMNSRTFQFFGNIYNRVNTHKKVVALTFDDAPTEYSNQVIQILKEHNTKATFYVIGGALEEYPKFGKDVALSGNEIGNHTYNHYRNVFKSYGFYKSEIDKTNSLIRQAGYKGKITFRPPYGKKLIGLPYYLYTLNMKTIMWDVDPLDDETVAGNSEKIVEYVVSKTQPGSIILLHPFCGSECQPARESIGPIIENLKSRGYEFVTVSDLLKEQ